MSNNQRDRAATVVLYAVATVFLVAALALMTQWMVGDPVGEPWLLASLLSVGGVSLLIASVRGARVDDDAGRNYRTTHRASRPQGASRPQAPTPVGSAARSTDV